MKTESDYIDRFVVLNGNHKILGYKPGANICDKYEF